MNKESTKIVLVEPRGAINLGSVARLCENFGITELRLVSPICNKNDPDAIKMALKGRNLLKEAKTYLSLIDAIEDCSRVIATCGRRDHGEIPLHEAQGALQWLRSDQKDTVTAIVFGREDRGLTNQELLLANKVITLKTSSKYPSLNLSHAVAIVLYELNQYNYNLITPTSNKNPIPAFPKELDNFLEDSKKLLLEIGYLLDHTAIAKMDKFKMLLHRAEIRTEEVALIRGIISQVRWAINKKKD
tara:strand:- start:341 stop:1075 length:735 start_codon:yes stop_codon:yes gene_type:complete